MANHSSNSLEMPLRLSAFELELELELELIQTQMAQKPMLRAEVFSTALPQVICGQPAGRECATQLLSNCRGARLMGIHATWPAQRRYRL